MANITNDQYYGIVGLANIFKEPIKKGIASITQFEFKENDNLLFNLRAAMENPLFRVREGKYVRLHVNNQLMMSDTGMERFSNKPFIEKAKGRVLIAGLGIGLVINNIISKDTISEIWVIEKHQDVIDLVAPYFNSPKLVIIRADIFEWKPPKGEKFDTIYFDVWPDICETNLEEIKILHNRFKHFKAPNGWMNSWMKEYLQKQKRK